MSTLSFLGGCWWQSRDSHAGRSSQMPLPKVLGYAIAMWLSSRNVLGETVMPQHHSSPAVTDFIVARQPQTLKFGSAPARILGVSHTERMTPSAIFIMCEGGLVFNELHDAQDNRLKPALLATTGARTVNAQHSSVLSVSYSFTHFTPSSDSSIPIALFSPSNIGPPRPETAQGVCLLYQTHIECLRRLTWPQHRIP